MHLVLIGVGGFIGSVLRYLVGAQFSGVLVPGGTFVVNVVGCFFMGIATAFGDARGWPSRETHLLVTTGVLGGFTTFSAFGQEAITLLRVDPLKGTVYSIVHVVLGIAAVGVGRAVCGLALRP